MAKVLRQVAHLLETGVWVDDIERAAIQPQEPANG